MSSDTAFEGSDAPGADEVPGANDALSKKLAVREVAGKGRCVFATEFIPAGAVMGYYEGRALAEPTMYSILLDGKNIDGGACILRYMAHACEPNAWFKDRRRWLHALEDIAPGAEVTIDYLYTEPVISAPFRCACGSPRCRGDVRTPEAG